MAFEIKSGLRRGDAMSPILFNVALENVVQEMSNRETWSLDRGMLLAYADDIIITGKHSNRSSNESEEINKDK
jgi:hypothetical protein